MDSFFDDDQNKNIWVIQIMKIIFVIYMCFIFSGCVIQQPQRPNDPYYAPVLQTAQVPAVAQNGSLYQANIALDLYSDIKASRVGDIITVTLEERTTSSKSSTVGVVKDNDIGILSDNSGVGTILGSTPSLGSFGLGTNLISEREFTGESEADQSNRLTGNISVTVVNVYPNGTLAIRGEKWMTLNRGDEYIRISGLVRPQDVSPDNTIVSTKIANARITYSGEGELANSQKMGWLSRFFNSPIWPY